MQWRRCGQFVEEHDFVGGGLAAPVASKRQRDLSAARNASNGGAPRRWRPSKVDQEVADRVVRGE
jgi:hypothetical protein